MVLITDIRLPRNQWPVGLVQETIKDKYGFVRVAKVRVNKSYDVNGQDSKETLIVRPITKLILLKESENLYS